MSTLLIGFDAAWTANHSGAIAGALRGSDGRWVEIGLPIAAGYRKAETIVEHWKANLVALSKLLI
jgi:hypothetical protein